MQVADEGPHVRMDLVDTQRFLEPLGGFVDLTTVADDAAKTQETVDVLRVLGQNVAVGFLSHFVLVLGFV